MGVLSKNHMKSILYQQKFIQGRTKETQYPPTHNNGPTICANRIKKYQILIRGVMPRCLSLTEPLRVYSRGTHIHLFLHSVHAVVTTLPPGLQGRPMQRNITFCELRRMRHDVLWRGGSIWDPGSWWARRLQKEGERLPHTCVNACCLGLT